MTTLPTSSFLQDGIGEVLQSDTANSRCFRFLKKKYVCFIVYALMFTISVLIVLYFYEKTSISSIIEDIMNVTNNTNITMI